MHISECKIIDFPRIIDPRGNLSFIESTIHVSFDIKRIFYIYDVPGGSFRGGHAHRSLHQLLIAVAGSFDVWLDDGYNKIKHSLNRSYSGLYIPPNIWSEIDNFSSGSVCLALASAFYDEHDYIRDYEIFKDEMRMRYAVSKIS